MSDHMHLAGCDRCAASAVAVRGDRDVVAAAFSLGDDAVNPAERSHAWARLQTAQAGNGAATAPPPRPRRRRSTGGRRPVVGAALVAGLLVVSGAAVAAAQDWLPIFQTRAVAALPLSAQDVAALNQAGQLAALSGYGDVSGPTSPQLVDVADAATAERRTGLTAPRPDILPPGVEGTPRYQVFDRQTVVFTFSAAKAAKTVAAGGATLPPPPPGLDGSTLRLQGGPGILATWTQRGGIPTLAVARVSAPTVAGDGLALPVVQDYFSALPGIPPALAARLRDVTANGTTLPIPVRDGRETTSSASVGDAPATVVETDDRATAGVIWIARGTIQAVAGPLSRDEVLAVARGLH
ncbi:MAG TPA: hypothetical protein VGE11_08885 [Pseudonocardia sp.]